MNQHCCRRQKRRPPAGTDRAAMQRVQKVQTSPAAVTRRTRFVMEKCRSTPPFGPPAHVGRVVGECEWGASHELLTADCDFAEPLVLSSWICEGWPLVVQGTTCRCEASVLKIADPSLRTHDSESSNLDLSYMQTARESQSQMTRRFHAFGRQSPADTAKEALLDHKVDMDGPRSTLPTHDGYPGAEKDARRQQKNAHRHIKTGLGLVAALLSLWAIVSVLSTEHGPSIPLLKGRLSASVPAARVVSLPHTYTDVPHSPTSAYNSTWGFGKIYALNLARRPDKVDQLTLMAKATGLDIEFYHPVPGDQLREEGLPPHGDDLSIGIAGCYRGHADLWRKILNGPEESVLIIEDDVDWEVDWKAALSRLVMPFSTLLASETGSPRTPTEQDPWSHQDWDTLFFGACTEKVMEPGNHPPDVDLNHLPVVIWNDTTVAHSDAWSTSFTDIFKAYNGTIPVWETPSEERQRLVARSVWPICTGSYAMTKRGAARALYRASRRLLPVDVSLGNAVLSGDLKSYTIVPSLISQYKVQKTGSDTGRSSLNSDLHRLDHPDAKTETLAEALKVDRFYDLEGGYSVDRRESVRSHLSKLVAALPASSNLWP
ncbi:unnamed protein product [Parajaminaea phylloscopi]